MPPEKRSDGGLGQTAETLMAHTGNERANVKRCWQVGA